MAQIGDGNTVYLRLLNGHAQMQMSVYGTQAEAQMDTNPSLAMQLYSASLQLLGTIVPTLVPVGGIPTPTPPNPHQAVTMIITEHIPINKA